MALDPWSYAEKTGKEHAHQAALFMWANMAMRFGLATASVRESYTVAGYAKQASAKALANSGVDDRVPQLKWLHAIHNQGRDYGQAGKIRGGIAKAEGVKAGVADLFLPVPKFASSYDEVELGGVVCGLYIELKVGNNKPSAEQLEFIADMRAAGYAADWVIGWELARQRILAYLQINC